MKIEFLSKMKTHIMILSLFCGMSTLAQDTEYSFNLNEFSYCSFYKYKIDKSFNSDNSFLNKLKNDYQSKNFFGEENQLNILSAMSFSWNGNLEMIIRYQKIENEQISYHYFYSDEKLKLKFNKIEKILTLKNDIFWQFYNNTNNSNFPEINRLKPQVKDADGTLNLFKLAEIIDKNKTILSKYFD